jgi:hypothetical protein
VEKARIELDRPCDGSAKWYREKEGPREKARDRITEPHKGKSNSGRTRERNPWKSQQ